MSTRPLRQELSPEAQRAGERLRVQAALEGAAIGAHGARLQALAGRFALSGLDADIVATLWLCAHDPALFAALAARDAVQGQVTVLGLAQLFGHAPRPRLPSDGPLLAWGMVEEHVLASGGAALTLDAGILAWLDGAAELDRALIGRAEIAALGPELADWPLDAVAGRVAARLRAGKASRLRLRTGDAAAARWFAAALGLRLGLPALVVTGDDPALAMRVHRQCFLDNAMPCLAARHGALSAPAGVSPFPVQLVHGEEPLPPLEAVLDMDVRLSPPGPDARMLLWRRFLPETAAWPAGEMETLALCHEAEAGEIAAVAARQPADAAEAGAHLRAMVQGETGPLTRSIDAVFGWKDLVLSESVESRLEEFLFEARERLRLWADPEAARLFPYGRGLVGLFAGPPGTGKTMAAQVMAAELGLDLLAVDLSAVVSKWVGETAQHLQAVLSSKAAQRAILFFDEADALYAKRVEDMRDAQDRYANMDTSHLMTALEAYPGIVILATNLKANIDSAYLRRIRHVVDFVKPDAAARAAIWTKVLGALFPAGQVKALMPGLERLARLEASGALIKNAALSALFAARRTGRAPDIRLLAEMLAREMAKDGMGLSARDLDATLEGGR